MTGLVSAAFVDSFGLIPGCFKLDVLDGSFDLIVNVSLRFDPGIEEVLDVDELELVRRLQLKPGAFRPLFDGTGI